MDITRFILRRLAFTVFTLIALTLVIFYTTTLFSPIERVTMFLSPYNYRDLDRLDWFQLAERLHFNDPFYVQYFDWIKVSLMSGKLGYSWTRSGFVLDVILQHLAPTIELVMYSGPIIIFGGIKLGEYAAKRAYRKRGGEDILDSIIQLFTTLAYSIPLFVIGLLSVSIFFLGLHWLPFGRLGLDVQTYMITSRSWRYYTNIYTIDALLNREFWVFSDALKHLALPVATLSISMLPIIVRITRSSMLEEFGRGYVIAAWARGLKEVEVVSHVRRNALIPILTISSIVFASMLTGIVVTEEIFSLDGIGSLAVYAAKRSDFALLAGLSVFFCFVFVTMNLIVDILYTHIDPRVKL